MRSARAIGEPGVDARAELYALGVLGYEMLAGAPPFAGGYRAEALTTAQRALALDSGHAAARQIVAQAYMRLGEYARAADEYGAVRRRLGLDGRSLGLLAAAYALSGRRERALALATELERGVPEDSAAANGLVYAYAGLGDVTRALDILDGLTARGQGKLVVRRIARENLSMWEPLRRDPRFARLRARMGLR